VHRGGDSDRRRHWRVLQCIFQQIGDGLVNQCRVDPDERQIVRLTDAGYELALLILARNLAY